MSEDFVDLMEGMRPSRTTSPTYKARVVLHVWTEKGKRNFEIFEKRLFLPQFKLNSDGGDRSFQYVDEWLGETDYSEIDELYPDNEERFVECLFDYRIHGADSFNGESHEWDEWDEIDDFRFAEIKDKDYLECIEKEGWVDENIRMRGLLESALMVLENELELAGSTPTDELEYLIEGIKEFGH